MFTAIVPTLQRSPYLMPLLDVLMRAELVAEIVLIDNATEPLLTTAHPKLDIVRPGRNLYVNPSWNLGAQRATQERLLIVNDDLVFPGPALSVLADRLDAGAGIVGLDLSCLSVDPDTADPGCRAAYVRRYGFGSLMALDRASYVPIPEDLLVWCGDDWLFRRQRRHNYVLTGVPIRTRMGTTSTAPEFAAIKARDLATFRSRYAANPYAVRHPVGYAAGRVADVWRGRVLDPWRRR